jgi:hypothetical protein
MSHCLCVRRLIHADHNLRSTVTSCYSLELRSLRYDGECQLEIRSFAVMHQRGLIPHGNTQDN